MDAVSLLTKRYHVGRATATSLANDYVSKLRRNYPSIMGGAGLFRSNQNG